ncbi:MAG: polyprenyl diphosphate synthase [Minisyncoccia bacterium]|jgi:undecaprenyl diphosphate synthase
MTNIPNHIAIIPDGNRRWAKQHHLLAWRGHKEGVERFHEVADVVFKHRVPYLTFWAASEDNLTKRSKHEVRFLVSLLKDWLRRELDTKDLVKNETKFRFIGRWRSILPGHDELGTLARALEEQTERFKKRNLTILFGYDGQREMIEAIKKIKKDPATEVNDGVLRKALWTGVLPPVDLVVRTGGEPHWSAGFMMWQTANAQFAFTQTLWPAFKKKELEAILDDFSKRERRFGK